MGTVRRGMVERSAGSSVAAFVAFAATTLAAAGLAGLFTSRSVGEWYPTLDTPPWTPPSWVISTAWSILYPLIAIAGWLIWRAGGDRSVAVPLALWGTQLVLNAGWSAVFFGLREPGWAFAEIVLLLAAVVATALAARPIAPVASLLFVPYAAWVAFAGTLNLAIWGSNA